MRLRRIEIQAFGVLENFRLDFTDGGQAFFALNESGKSTCLAFIRVALYGMPRNQQSLLRSLRRRYQPFSKDYSAGALLFEHEGREYRLTRHFAVTPAGDRTEFRDELLGDVIPLKDPSAPGVELLGMELGAFLNTAFVAQMELPYSSDADKDGALIKHLTDLGSTGDAEASITGLRDRLTEAERHLSSRQRASSLIPQLEREIEELATEEAEARLKRDTAANIREKITRQEQELRDTEATLKGLRTYQDLTRLKQQAQQIEEQIERSKAARSQVADLRALRQTLESGEAYEGGEGPRRLAIRIDELRSHQDGQHARWTALRSVPETLEPEVEEAFEVTQGLLKEVQAQQRRAAAGAQVSEQLQRELQELQIQQEAKLEEQRSSHLQEQEGLENLRQSLRSMEAQERQAHDEVVRIEQLNREEGFSAGQKHVQALKTYGDPLTRSVSLGSSIQALARQEVRILKELEDQESESAQAKLKSLAEFSASRIAFTESLEHLPEDYQPEAGNLDDWRKILNPSFSTGSEDDQVVTSSHDDYLFDEGVVDDFDYESMELSPEGQRILAEYRELQSELEETSLKRETAEQDLDRRRSDYYEKRSEVEAERKLISDVRTPSRAGTVFWPILAVVSAIVGILAIVWMIRSDYLFLVLAALSFAVSGFALYRFRELQHALKLAEEIQRRRHMAAQAAKVVSQAEQDMREAEENLQALRDLEQSLQITVQRSGMTWEGRKDLEAKQQKKLREVRLNIAELKTELAQLDESLPQKSDDYRKHLEAFSAEEKARDERLEQARETHLKLKKAVDQASQQLAEAETTYQEKMDGEEEQERTTELQALEASLQAKREEIRQQNEDLRADRAELEQEIKSVGFKDSDELEKRYEELHEIRNNHVTSLKNSKEEAAKLIESLRLLEGDWSELLELGRAVYAVQDEEDLWQTFEVPDFSRAKGDLSRAEAMDILDNLRQELQRLDDSRKVKERRYDQLLAELKTVEDALTGEEEEAERKAKQDEIKAKILKLEEKVEGIVISNSDSNANSKSDANSNSDSNAKAIPEEADIEAEILAKEQRVRELTAEVSGLRSSIRNEEDRTPEEVLREKQAIEEELAYRRLQLAAIQLAQEASEQAYKEMRERFSPQLQAYASEYLERITEGRYRRLIVKSDEKDMILEVFDEDEGRAIEGEYLSGAAYEQIYLALRLGMIRILDPDHRLPLLFDDILVQFDLDRERACLELFNDLAAEGRQIIYFTCSEAMASRIKDIAPTWEIRPLI